ncbi:hypothetical protein IP69_17305 [Bosea sp. AAP35]|nr:response regulator [Bosea sp. AAP35]KPF65698.1 hypothetical protein IP69_17305 [Bosea sp. AAP35]MCC5611814.1 response regulator [Nostoc sp. CHAB 5834]
MDGPTGGPRVLILEDEAIIAMDVEGILTDAGFDVMATVASCAAAMDWLVADRVDVALLDLDLLDGSSDLVARRLNDLGIPFVVFSGSSQKNETIHPVFLTGGWLEKPSPAERIVAAVRQAVLPEPVA